MCSKPGVAPARRLALALLLACAGACVVPVEIGTGWPDAGPSPPDAGLDAGLDAGAPEDAGPGDAAVPITGARFCIDPHTCQLLRDDGGVPPAPGGFCGATAIGANCMCTRDDHGQAEPLACGSACVPDTLPRACSNTNCGDIECLAPAVCSRPGQCG